MEAAIERGEEGIGGTIWLQRRRATLAAQAAANSRNGNGAHAAAAEAALGAFEQQEGGEDAAAEEESSAADSLHPPQEVFVVDSVAKARRAAARLAAMHAADPSTIFACDTEVRAVPFPRSVIFVACISCGPCVVYA